ncbi:hypothetical protein EMGBS3_03490 [Anaerolineaceae bacterium]|nr:hypothetical protein EMGBS3_03490 [Anaerolineaceae bacterium]
MEARGARKISFLPCACDPALYHPEPAELVRRSSLESSICLIGTFSPARGVMLESLAGIDNIAIWGPGWQPTLKQLRGKLAHNIFRGEGLPPGQVSHAYQSAPIVVNTHGPQTKLGGLNTRAFEVPACGAFQLMDYVPEMEALLQPGHDVAVYRTPQEAGTLAREYLADPEARQRIARQGMRACWPSTPTGIACKRCWQRSSALPIAAQYQLLYKHHNRKRGNRRRVCLPWPVIHQLQPGRT